MMLEKVAAMARALPSALGSPEEHFDDRSECPVQGERTGIQTAHQGR
jgi:hypothetical protein